ncbi:hypothetical protein Tco_0224256, partial [Tanacetum coccineum]
KAMSRRDRVTYCKEPTTCRYFTGLEKAVLSSKLSGVGGGGVGGGGVGGGGVGIDVVDTGDG